MGKGKFELDLIYVNIMIIQCLHTFLGGDLQMVYADLLRLVSKYNLSYQKASEFILISEFIEN